MMWISATSARAKLPTRGRSDAFIRIHANGSVAPAENGVRTICHPKNNPYNGGIYAQCLSLSQALLDGIVSATGANDRGVWQTDTMSGINWSKVPVTIVEMGYMTNEEEDRLMATDDYRMLIVRGIADGLDQYFEELQ
jgi:N-acetylmuramoyl-L-alanine amidase